VQPADDSAADPSLFTQGMQVGGERRLTIPPASGYGRSGAPPAIPGNATLVFDIKMVDLK